MQIEQSKVEVIIPTTFFIILFCNYSNSIHYSQDHCQNNPVAPETIYFIVTHDYSIRVLYCSKNVSIYFHCNLLIFGDYLSSIIASALEQITGPTQFAGLALTEIKTIMEQPRALSQDHSYYTKLQ